jgi:hypothetical protein
MRVKSCICSRLQQLWTRRFNWRIARWLQQTHARGRIQYRCDLVPASQLLKRVRGLPITAGMGWHGLRLLRWAAPRRRTPSRETSSSIFSEMKELRVSSSSWGFEKGRRSPFLLATGYCFAVRACEQIDYPLEAAHWTARPRSPRISAAKRPAPELAD